jgi:hypothetical protein
VALVAGRAPSLDGCFAKLRRAEDHVGLVEAYVRRPPPVPLAEKREFDATGETLRVSAEVVSIPPFPDYWSTTIGDAVQNIRIALEYLVYELIAVENGGIYSEDSEFPIATTPSGHTSRRSKETIKLLGPHWTVIQGYQPYGGSNPPTLHDDLFKFMRDFSNQDKHRLLVPVNASLNFSPVTFPISPGRDVSPIGVPWFNVGVLEPGAILAREDFLVTGPNPQVHMYNNYIPTICFAELPGIGVGDILRMMLAKENKLVEEFTSFF